MYEFLDWLPRSRFLPAGWKGFPKSLYCKLLVGRSGGCPTIGVDCFAYDNHEQERLEIVCADDGLLWWFRELREMWEIL